MLLELKRIYVPPGQKVLLRDVTWQELETILEELGEHRAARIAYDKGILEIMAPLPLIDAIPQYLDQSIIIGRNATLKKFRIWVRQQIQQS